MLINLGKKIKRKGKSINMSDFDYDKIKDMKYDPNRGCYVGKNGEEFHVNTLF